MPPEAGNEPPHKLISAEAQQRIPPDLIGKVLRAYGQAKAPGTRTLYAKHQGYFHDWCQETELTPLPADTTTVAAYIAERADTVAVATIRTALAAIRSEHEDNGWESPTTTAAIKEIMRGLARTHPQPDLQADGIDQDIFDRIVAAARRKRPKESRRTAAKRGTLDVALISFMRDGMLRRSEAASAQWRHISQDKNGDFNLYIPSSKTDKISEGAAVHLTMFTMEALAEMLRCRGGDPPRPEDRIFQIGERQVANRIKAAAERAGIRERITGHSPRIGMTIDMVQDDIEMPAIMEAGRWISEKTANRYARKLKASKNGVAKRNRRREEARAQAPSRRR